MKQKNLSNTEIADLCKQLGLLMQAGVTLGDGLHLLSEEEKEAPLSSLLADLAKEVEEGNLLCQAFSKAGCFPVYVTGLLAVGEQVGRTEETLFALSRYYEEQERMNRRLRSALTYPNVLLLMMLVVIVVLLTQVLPVFDDVYASLGGSLTGLAGGLLTLGNILRKMLPILVLVLILLMVLAAVFSLSPTLRNRSIAFLKHYLGDKGVFRKINDARFAQALSMAFCSGMALEEGVDLAAALLQEYPAAVSRCEACRDQLAAGEDLASALGASGMIPVSACRMLTLGMRAGNGDTVMQEIAKQLSEDADEALERKVAAIEPALVLITSLLVGAILLSVMLPLMHIMKAIG